jgi:hypothetical protein
VIQSTPFNQIHIKPATLASDAAQANCVTASFTFNRFSVSFWAKSLALEAASFALEAASVAPGA